MDDALSGETESIQRTGHTGRAEEWHEPEPEGEDQPEVDLAPNATLTGGTPAGMSAVDVTERSELARFLRPSAFPADARTLLAIAADEGAPEWIRARLRGLSEHGDAAKTFQNTQELWKALGGGVESGRP